VRLSCRNAFVECENNSMATVRFELSGIIELLGLGT
jgi:hypothetical protein